MKKEIKIQKAKRQLREIRDQIPVKQLAIKDKAHGGGAGGGKTGDGKGGKKGGGKKGGGKKGGGKGDRVPQGAFAKDDNDKAICFAHNSGGCTHPACRFEHACWWCKGAGCARCPAA